MPTAEDFYKWMKEFHPGIHLVGFQRKLVDAHFENRVVTNVPRLIGKKFLRKKITEFEEYWRQKNMQKTFNIKFKEVGTGAYKAFAPSKRYPDENPNWHNCPQIEECPVSEFLDKLNFAPAEDMAIVPREQRPEMSVAAIFRQVVGEVYQHQGHIAYLKGLLRAGK